MSYKNLEDYVNRCYQRKNKWNNDVRFLRINEEDDCLSYSYSDQSDRDYCYEGEKSVPVIMPEYCSGSDYSGDTVTRSNYLAIEKWLEEEDHVHGVYLLSGSYSTYAVAISIDPEHMSARSDDQNDWIVDMLVGLEDYPVIDEDLMSELESDLEMEYWEQDLRTELMEDVELKFDIDIDLDSEISGSEQEKNESRFYELYVQLCDLAGEYMIFEIACIPYIDVSKLVEYCDESLLKEYKIPYKVSE